MHFAEILEAVDQLSFDEQTELVEVVRRRLIERRRGELGRDVRQARKDFKAGRCLPRTPGEILRDITS